MNSILRSIHRWERKALLSKRQLFVLITLLLTAGLIITQIVPADLRYPCVIIFSAAAYVLTAFGLREDLRGIEWLTLLTLPTLFTAAVLLYYFLLPGRWLTRLPVTALFAVGMYALLLTENIYNVAAERSIALLRAAHSVGFLLTLITYFLLVSTIFAFRMAPGFTALSVFVVTFFLVVQGLWSVVLESGLGKRVVGISISLAVLLAELAWIFGFWPVSQALIVLFLTTVLYCTVGMAQQYLGDKLYKKTVVEFGVVAAIVLVIVLVATRWRGFM
jgi:hypothetical protein